MRVARVVELVDAGDSKSPAARRAGSSPASGTSLISIDLNRGLFLRLKIIKNSKKQPLFLLDNGCLS